MAQVEEGPDQALADLIVGELQGVEPSPAVQAALLTQEHLVYLLSGVGEEALPIYLQLALRRVSTPVTGLVVPCRWASEANTL